MQFFFLFIFIALPIALYLWKESRYNNPAVRWQVIAEDLNFTFSPSPPQMKGTWKGREISAFAESKGASFGMPLSAAKGVRVQIGPKVEMETEAGMIVPDKVTFGDLAFEARYLVRSAPRELGEMAVDPGMRRALLKLPDLRVMAQSDGVQLRTPPTLETDTVRSYMDIVVTLGDALENYS